LTAGETSLRRVTSCEEEHVAADELPPEAEGSATCADCGMELVVARVTPVWFGGEFEELTLACKSCGFTKKIKIKRS
jgi:RNase P subunit RPR2